MQALECDEIAKIYDYVIWDCRSVGDLGLSVPTWPGVNLSHLGMLLPQRILWADVQKRESNFVPRRTSLDK